MPAPRTHVPTAPRPYIPKPSKQAHADPRSVTQTKDIDRGQPGKVPAVALDPAKGMGPKTDRQRSQAPVRVTTRPMSVPDFPIAGSAEHTERVQWTGGREARARRTPRSRRAWEGGVPLSARPPPVCWVGPMRSDRGRSFVVEPQPPGASCPRPCPPPPALGRSQGAPRGLLKRHALSAPRTPQRRLFPRRGRGIDPGGGGAEQELGVSRRRSGVAWAFHARVFDESRIFLAGEFGWGVGIGVDSES